MAGPDVVIFHPILDTHYENFLPLHRALAEGTSCRPIFLETPQLVPSDREIRWAPSSSTGTIRVEAPGARHGGARSHARLASAAELELATLLSSSGRALIVVGNDDRVFAKRFLLAARRRGVGSLLLQDGWLESRNLIRTVDGSRWGRLSPILRQVERVMSSRYSPVAGLRATGIGSNVDYIGVYSDGAAKEFAEAGMPTDRLFVTGSPRHSLLRDQVARARAHGASERHWLVLPTGVVKPAHVAATLDAISWVLDHDPTRARSILVKLHPRSPEEAFRNFVARHSGVQLVDRQAAMPAIWATTDLAFTFGSTSTVDAFAAGVAVVELAPAALRNAFGNLHSGVPRADCAGQLEEAIHLALAQDPSSFGHLLADCKPEWNSVEKASELVLRLLQRSKDHSIHA